MAKKKTRVLLPGGIQGLVHDLRMEHLILRLRRSSSSQPVAMTTRRTWITTLAFHQQPSGHKAPVAVAEDRENIEVQPVGKDEEPVTVTPKRYRQQREDIGIEVVSPAAPVSVRPPHLPMAVARRVTSRTVVAGSPRRTRWRNITSVEEQLDRQLAVVHGHGAAVSLGRRRVRPRSSSMSRSRACSTAWSMPAPKTLRLGHTHEIVADSHSTTTRRRHPQGALQRKPDLTR